MQKNIFSSKQNKAFSLVEISITLVIISLIIAATLQGKNLLKSTRLKSLISDVNEYRIAINSFYSKYSYYPGDYNEASINWGNNAEDGNADYLIQYKNDDDIYEGYNAWDHLYYAKMISIKYNNAKQSKPIIGKNIPESKIPGNGIMFDSNRMGFVNSNLLLFGIPIVSSDLNAKLNSSLTPQDAHSIDSKSDDGIPNKGNIRAENGNDSTDDCYTQENYKLNSKNKNCILGFKISL